MPSEIYCWVLVQSDDQVVIRIVRNETGQSTLTGRAQLVAEALGCDWSKITTEHPTPGPNLARNRVRGTFRPAPATSSASRTTMCARAVPRTA